MNRRKRQRVKESTGKQLLEQLKGIDWRAQKAKVQTTLGSLRLRYLELPSLHQKLIPAIAVLLIVLLVIPTPDPEATPAQPVPTQRVELDIDTRGLSEQGSTVVSASSPNEQVWTEYVIQDGDTLAKVFRSNDLSVSDLNALVKIEGIDKPLSRIRKGQLIRFKLDANDQLDILQLERGSEAVMFFRLSDGGFGRSK
jgi:cell envelope opacity-associated protein A